MADINLVLDLDSYVVNNDWFKAQRLKKKKDKKSKAEFKRMDETEMVLPKKEKE